MSDVQTPPMFDSTMSYDQLFIDLLKNLPDELCETLRVGALPHFLDEGLAEVLFPGNLEASLERVRSFPFVTETSEGRYEYHQSTRQLLLKNWQTDHPQLYRKLNGQLANEFMHRLEKAVGNSMNVAVEWVYHSVAANPEAGMQTMVNLFHELLETRELGTADRLLRLVSDQQSWLGEQAPWLDYFQAALKFQRFQPVDLAALDKLAQQPLDMLKQAPSDTGIFLSGRSAVRRALKQKEAEKKAAARKEAAAEGTVQSQMILENSLLTGCVRRLQGRIALADQQWSLGRRYLKQALAIFKHLENFEELALTHLELGNRYYAQAVSSGGIQAEQPSLDSKMGAFLFKFSRLPLRCYRWLAERIDPLPDLYDGSYQNWMVLSMLRLARKHYQEAGELFKVLGNQRGCLETDFYVGRIMLVLGYTGNCARVCSKAKKRPLAASSPYYTARLDLILAQSHMKHGGLEESRKLLENCLDIFTRYGDWRLVLEAAIALGTGLEGQKDWHRAVEVAGQGLEAARNSFNPLAETRLASRLDWYSQMTEIDPADREKSRQLRETITRLAFIDRFPGPVRRTFQGLANWLAYPFAFLFALSLILASGVLMQFIEGEVRVQPGPVDWSQAGGLIFYLVLPVLMLWGYYVFYLVIGQLVSLLLTVRQVDQTQPETWSVEQTGISKFNDPGSVDQEQRLDWSWVNRLVIDNRALYCIPIISSSRMHLVPIKGEAGLRQELVLPASIFRYGALQGELEKRLSDRVVKLEFSFLRTRWLWISVALGLGIALAGVLGAFGNPFYGCYGQVLRTAADECRIENRLYIQPVMLWGMFFASLIFGLVTWVRWQVMNRKVKKALEV